MSSQLYIGNDLSAVPSVVIEKIVPMPLSVQYKKDASGKLLKPDNELDITGVTGITDVSLFKFSLFISFHPILIYILPYIKG